MIAAFWVAALSATSLRSRMDIMALNSANDLALYAVCALGAVGLIVWGMKEGRKERVNLGIAGFALTILFFYFSTVMDKLGRSASLIGLGLLFLLGGWLLEKTRRRLMTKIERRCTMNPFVKGLIIAVIHVCLVSALGAKLLYDRATLPRVWVKTAPYDPNLPIRGRYVSLRVVVEPRGIKETKEGPESGWQPAQSVGCALKTNIFWPIAKHNSTPYNPSGLHVRYAKSRRRKRGCS